MDSLCARFVCVWVCVFLVFVLRRAVPEQKPKQIDKHIEYLEFGGRGGGVCEHMFTWCVCVCVQ